MSRSMKFNFFAIVMELFSLSLQALGIVALLVLTFGNAVETLFTIILGIVLLKVTRRQKIIEDYGNFLLTKKLFGALGQWQKREDAERLFDEALTEAHMIDGRIEDDTYVQLITAAGVADGVRAWMSFLLHGYLGAVILLEVVEALS